MRGFSSPRPKDCRSRYISINQSLAPKAYSEQAVRMTFQAKKQRLPFFVVRAAEAAMLRANEVFTHSGRVPMSTRSESPNPIKTLSRSVNPVRIPFIDSRIYIKLAQVIVNAYKNILNMNKIFISVSLHRFEISAVRPVPK